MKKDEMKDNLDVVIGTLSIHSYPVTVLFDYDAKYSFITYGTV